MKKTGRNVTILAVLLLTSLVVTGCSTTSRSQTVTGTVIEQSYIPPDPGAVEYVWEAPLIDVVDVPPGLDPEGHYYRPAHQEVVEIRQGRWRYYKSVDQDR